MSTAEREDRWELLRAAGCCCVSGLTGVRPQHLRARRVGTIGLPSWVNQESPGTTVAETATPRTLMNEDDLPAEIPHDALVPGKP